MTIKFERKDYDVIRDLLTKELDDTCDMLIFKSAEKVTVDKLIDLAKARNNLRHTYLAVNAQ